MPKTTGPCFSLSARGTIANQLTFSSANGRPYVKTKSNPRNPQSTGQTYTRDGVRFITRLWAQLTAAHQQSWQLLADTLNLTPYHAFLKFNTARWRDGLPPAMTTAPSTHDAVELVDHALWQTNGLITVETTISSIASPLTIFQFIFSTTPPATPEKYDIDYTAVAATPDDTEQVNTFKTKLPWIVGIDIRLRLAYPDGQPTNWLQP